MTDKVLVTDSQRKLLTDALVVPKPFYCQGLWTFAPSQLHLFYGREPSCRRLNLSKDAASAAELENLAAACQPATFGRGQTDVLDETYRKAGKLDNEDFALNLDLAGSGLLDVVNAELFGWQDEARFIKAELYKLNVYGPGSFFKAHCDTPRSETMFGSIVLTFATEHEGGSLMLRHDGQEVEHKTSNTSHFESPHQVFWAAFFSDVEHEVLPVTSGHRVTLTYNLFFTSQKADVRPSTPDDLLDAFKTVLADPSFMPDGGRLGFGLRHRYPIPADAENDSCTFLRNLRRSLKGNDHALFSTAAKVGLQPALHVVYDYSGCNGAVYMVHCIWTGGHNVESLAETLDEDFGSDLEYLEPEDDPPHWRDRTPVQDLVWILPRKSSTEVGTHYGACGNEASCAVIYGAIVLIANVPSAADRGIAAA